MVVGSGKLANELLENLSGPHIASVLPWAQRESGWNGCRIVVHAGSGREIADVTEFCALHSLVLVELSTSGALEQVNPTFPVILCPNTNILMLKFMAMLKVQGHLFSEYETTILESHQSDKKSEPGTAISIAASLGVPRDEITSVRDPLVQKRQLGIPAEHLARHAYHKISIADGNVSIAFEAKVLGEAPYAAGLAKIVEGIYRRDLESRKYDVLELVQNGWI